MSELAVGSLKGLAANSFVIDIAAGSTLNVPPPAILQVVQTTKSDSFTAALAGGTTTTITGFSASITPSSVSSKVLVTVEANGSASTVNDAAGIIVERGGTPIGLGDTASNRTRLTSGYGSSGDQGTHNATVVILDSPATTSSVTYTVAGFFSPNGGGTGTGNFYLNRGNNDPDTARSGRTASRITLMEVAG